MTLLRSAGWRRSKESVELLRSAPQRQHLPYSLSDSGKGREAAESEQCHSQWRRRKRAKRPAAMAAIAPTTIGKAAPCSSSGMCCRFIP